MAHHIPDNHLIPKGVVAFSSYSKLSDEERRKAILDNYNTERTITSIQDGYRDYLRMQEANHREQIASMTQQAEAMDVRMSALASQQELTNTKLEDIKEALGIPEFEKKRKFHYSEGIKYLKQAQNNPARYNEALCSFLNAEEINDKDYIVLYQIGLIYLHSSENVDLAAAEDYLIRAKELAEGVDEKVFSDCQNQIGYIKFLSGNFFDALDILTGIPGEVPADRTIMIIESLLGTGNVEKVIEKLSFSPVSILKEVRTHNELNKIDSIVSLINDKINSISNEYEEKLMRMVEITPDDLKNFVELDELVEMFHRGDKEEMFENHGRLLRLVSTVESSIRNEEMEIAQIISETEETIKNRKEEQKITGYPQRQGINPWFVLGVAVLVGYWSWKIFV